MTELKRFESLRSVSAYVNAWNAVHKPEKIRRENVYQWVRRGILESKNDGSPHGLRVVDGLEIEKHTRSSPANENYCEKCERFFDNLSKHMKRHALIAERIIRFEDEEAKRNNGSTS